MPSASSPWQPSLLDSGRSHGFPSPPPPEPVHQQEPCPMGAAGARVGPPPAGGGQAERAASGFRGFPPGHRAPQPSLRLRQRPSAREWAWTEGTKREPRERAVGHGDWHFDLRRSCSTSGSELRRRRGAPCAAPAPHPTGAETTVHTARLGALARASLRSPPLATWPAAPACPGSQSRPLGRAPDQPRPHNPPGPAPTAPETRPPRSCWFSHNLLLLHGSWRAHRASPSSEALTGFRGARVLAFPRGSSDPAGLARHRHTEVAHLPQDTVSLACLQRCPAPLGVRTALQPETAFV